MARIEIEKTPRFWDEVIAQTSNPRHKRMLQNFRNHFILEVCAEGHQIIYGPGMTSENPEYTISWRGLFTHLQGREAVYEKLYQPLGAGGTVTLPTKVELFVSDNAITADITSRQFGKGASFQPLTTQRLDPSERFTRSSRGLLIFTYDQDARLSGERAASFHPEEDFVVCPAEEFIELAEVRAKLLPLVTTMDEVEFA